MSGTLQNQGHLSVNLCQVLTNGVSLLQTVGKGLGEPIFKSQFLQSKANL